MWRNLDGLQKDYLIGKRYEVEKRKDGGHGAQKAGSKTYTPKTRERLAEEYNLSPATISNDAAFAQAVDILEDAASGMREAILTPVLPEGAVDPYASSRPTEQQATRTGKRVAEKTVEPLAICSRLRHA